ncbi:MAG: nucleotide exchange factor GrpE [Thermodesulfobacteriota bacterium]
MKDKKKKEKVELEEARVIGPVEGEGESGPVEAPGREERVKRLEEEIEALKKEADENRDRFLRATADLENSKKRWAKEKADCLKYASEGFLVEILPVIDNLERALEHALEGNDNTRSLAEGVKLTLAQLHKVLEKFGVKEIEALGEVFDPELHHAIMHEESADAPAGVVLKELQKGYLLKDKLLRPALVSVTKEKEEEGPEE